MDVTASSSPLCGDVETFRIPVVETLPPSDVGATNSTNGGFGTLNGQWSGVTPGNTIKTFYRCGMCNAPYPTNSALTANTAAASAQATWTMSPELVTGLATGDVCYQACYFDTTEGTGPFCSDVQTFSVPGVQTDPPTNVFPTNNPAIGGYAQFEGSYTGYPAGHNRSSWYSYAPCQSYPGDAIRTANRSTTNAPASGSLPGVPVQGLPVGVKICYEACVVDDTTKSAPNCGDVERFTILAQTTAPTPAPTPAPSDCPGVRVKVKPDKTRDKKDDTIVKAGDNFKVQ